MSELRCCTGCTYLGVISFSQSLADNGDAHGTFSLRSPVRPNPIGTSIALLERVDGATVHVRELDCIAGTPLLDLKSDRTLSTPIAPPQAGDFEVGHP
jgi:tRNA (Thr-GGU) A37 N-methylase